MRVVNVDNNDVTVCPVSFPIVATKTVSFSTCIQIRQLNSQIVTSLSVAQAHKTRYLCSVTGLLNPMALSALGLFRVFLP